LREIEMKNTIVVYHYNCNDGIASAWAMHKAFGNEAEYIGGIHGKEPRFDPKGKTIYMVDFCYPPDVTLNLFEEGAEKIIVIDHHKRPVEALLRNKELQEMPNFEVHYGSFENSGAVLTFFYVKFDMEGCNALDDTLLPLFFKYVEDRDLWEWKYDLTKPILEVFRMEPTTIERVDEFVNICEDSEELQKTVKIGQALIKAYETEKEQTLNRGRRPIKIFNQSLEVVNCPPKFSSDIGHELAKDNNIGLTYCDTEEFRIFAIRGNGKVNVAKLAEKYGGGGHHNAAGFTVPRHHPLAKM